eukprot:m.12220 g.12220  ORF g.12220 m.12220 type:complete len:357 (+) comp5975_c0_seq1:170-1240(+)
MQRVEDDDGEVRAFAPTSSPPPTRRRRPTRPAEPRDEDESDRAPTPTVTADSGVVDTDDGGPENLIGSRTETVGRTMPVPRRDGEVSIVVGGRRFVCSTALFQGHPETMLGRMFGACLDSQLTRPDDNGDYVITHAVTAAAFQSILHYYRSGQIRCPPNVSVAELHEACNYFLIPFTHTSVKSEHMAQLLQQLSNQGARSQFEEFIEEILLPAMARGAAMGERDCHVVCLDDADTVEWDEDLPPRLGEQWAQIVHSTRLFRFLKDHENRLIAKQMLKEKGLKSIRIGIEGFPTSVSRIRTGSNGDKIEVEYNYEQRPFLRASWASEEGKSRHVDFQCVRPMRTASAAAVPSLSGSH